MRRTLKDPRPAPGELRIVQELVNTANLEAKTDVWSSPAALADWLMRQALLLSGTELDGTDVENATVIDLLDRKEDFTSASSYGVAKNAELTSF